MVKYIDSATIGFCFPPMQRENIVELHRKALHQFQEEGFEEKVKPLLEKMEDPKQSASLQLAIASLGRPGFTKPCWAVVITAIL